MEDRIKFTIEEVPESIKMDTFSPFGSSSSGSVNLHGGYEEIIDLGDDSDGINDKRDTGSISLDTFSPFGSFSSSSVNLHDGYEEIIDLSDDSDGIKDKQDEELMGVILTTLYEKVGSWEVVIPFACIIFAALGAFPFLVFTLMATEGNGALYSFPKFIDYFALGTSVLVNFSITLNSFIMLAGDLTLIPSILAKMIPEFIVNKISYLSERIKLLKGEQVGRLSLSLGVLALLLINVTSGASNEGLARQTVDRMLEMGFPASLASYLLWAQFFAAQALTYRATVSKMMPYALPEHAAIPKQIKRVLIPLINQLAEKPLSKEDCEQLVAGNEYRVAVDKFSIFKWALLPLIGVGLYAVAFGGLAYSSLIRQTPWDAMSLSRRILVVACVLSSIGTKGYLLGRTTCTTVEKYLTIYANGYPKYTLDLLLNRQDLKKDKTVFIAVENNRVTSFAVADSRIFQLEEASQIRVPEHFDIQKPYHGLSKEQDALLMRQIVALVAGRILDKNTVDITSFTFVASSIGVLALVSMTWLSAATLTSNNLLRYLPFITSNFTKGLLSGCIAGLAVGAINFSDTLDLGVKLRTRYNSKYYNKGNDCYFPCNSKKEWDTDALTPFVHNVLLLLARMPNRKLIEKFTEKASILFKKQRIDAPEFLEDTEEILFKDYGRRFTPAFYELVQSIVTLRENKVSLESQLRNFQGKSEPNTLTFI